MVIKVFGEEKREVLAEGSDSETNVDKEIIPVVMLLTVLGSECGGSSGCSSSSS